MTIYSPSASLDVSATTPHRSLLRRFLDAIMQGRQRKAAAGLARYLHDHQHSLDAELRSELERRLVAQNEAARRLRPVVGVLLALTSAVALSVAGSDAFADPQPTSFDLACALKEVKVITLIEEHGEARDLPADSLADAGMAMLRARATCYEGRVTEALALYDGILTLGPVVSLRAQ
jgi:hypothetical protein